MNFPPYPRTATEIYEFPGHGEYMACTIVHRTDARQLMAFRTLRLKLGEQTFRESLVEALDILSHATGIHTPAGWLYNFIAQEVPHV